MEVFDTDKHWYLTQYKIKYVNKKFYSPVASCRTLVLESALSNDCKYKTRVEVSGTNKHWYLEMYRIIFVNKKFYSPVASCRTLVLELALSHDCKY